MNNQIEDEHIIEALGMSQITIKNGEITKITEPKIDYCPLFNKKRNIKTITKEEIKENIEFRIKDFGMCTKNRSFEIKDLLTVGISEILKTNVAEGNLDCVVGVCEGVGTLLLTDPDLIQGVGGRVSGLVKTTPILEIIDKLDEKNILDPKTAEINQIKGVKKAIKEGYKNIAVTVVSPKDVQEINKIRNETKSNIYILVAHTSTTTIENAELLFENADIITACASKNVIKLAEEKQVYHYGKSVPIYAITENGRKLLDTRLEFLGKNKSTNNYPIKDFNPAKPLI
ncbi:MAG: DUF2099 family protein [Methanobacteriaceae archaeon]|nr:DUF2099 family protein [Methanobacteriaceae archaeon]